LTTTFDCLTSTTNQFVEFLKKQNTVCVENMQLAADTFPRSSCHDRLTENYMSKRQTSRSRQLRASWWRHQLAATDL